MCLTAARTATFAAHQLNWIDRLSVDVDLISTLCWINEACEFKPLIIARTSGLSFDLGNGKSVKLTNWDARGPDFAASLSLIFYL